MTDQNNSNTNPSSPKGEGSIWAGIGFGLVIYIVTFLFGTAIGQTSFLIFTGPILHLVAMIVFFAIGKKFTGIGLLILAGIIILLVSACFGIVLYQFNSSLQG
ncbi:hypothetical protein [Bacillus sp. FJAT-49736]|uniref:hypothetical protein n=1 Tax=Bacillus sp. FJAT-49736 TaxID=2833582 RepID=UPI001BCA54D0|nr:hypothetical protein [Bacillus sp. FJAT-49736]MBS4173058.1 hypothetical protein [Bacillus sp. FJAT-49736]